MTVLVQLDDLIIGSFLDLDGFRNQNQLNVTWVSHIWVDTAVGTVSTTTLLWSLVDLDVFNDQIVSIQTLGNGIGLGVFQQIQNEFDGLNGPSALSDTKFLGLRSTANTALEASERNAALMFLDGLQILVRILQLQVLDGSSSLTGVL